MSLRQRSSGPKSTAAAAGSVAAQQPQQPAHEQHEPAGFFDKAAAAILVALSPTLCQVLAFITNSCQFNASCAADASFGAPAGANGTHVKFPRSLTGFVDLYKNKYLPRTAGGFNDFYADMIVEASQEVGAAVTFLLMFSGLALVLYWWRGGVANTEFGPITPHGARPDYIDNGVAHSVLFTVTFLGLSDFSSVFGLESGCGCFRTAGWFALSGMFDHFQSIVLSLNVFGLVFCVFLYFKGKYAPSGPDNGSSGNGVVFDYYWGMELYPRIFGVDVKRFVNCRFSMTFWMLAGISFLAASVNKADGDVPDLGAIKPGLFFSALSQFIYLAKFFKWEIGYMRSIDIIVDRAGFYETWGCLVWVPSVYTLHSRILVNTPNQHTWESAGLIFLVGTVGGVLLNFWADSQRQWFREANGDITIWGKKAEAVPCKYTVNSAGKLVQRESLLLVSGFWGLARHFQYLFELMAAWSWCLLGTSFDGADSNGVLPLFYAVFLTILLIHRADRDEEKCIKKYGDGYREYMKRVPYKIIPGLY